MGTMKIFLIGDSISIHYGPYLESALAGIMEYSRKAGLAEALRCLDNPQGANGGDSRMVLSYLLATEQHKGIDADILLLNCGLHDIRTNPVTGARQVGLEQYRQNLKAILQVLSRMRPAPVWIRTTPCDESVHNARPNMEFHRFSADCRTYNEAADEIMLAAGVPEIDLFSFTRNLGRDIYCDHVPFHDHIRRAQAAFIAGWLCAFTSANRLPGRRA